MQTHCILQIVLLFFLDQSMIHIFSEIFPDIYKSISQEYLEKNENLKRDANILYKAISKTAKMIKEKDIERRISEYNG